MKNVIFSVILLFVAFTASAQNDSQTGYNFLRLPVGAHAGALGGDNITIIEDDPSLMFQNPALLSSVNGRALNLNYMNYMQGCHTASAAYAMTAGEKGSVGIMAQFMSYGEMKETTADAIVTGTFTAKDIAIGATYSHLLGRNFVAGITAKAVNSYIGQYSSLAVAVDLGMNYYDPESEWSLSAVVRNLGGELDAYDENYTRLPADVQVGVSKRLVGSPLRLSMTLVDMNHLDYKFVNHLVVGADLILSPQIYLAAGYNFRRAKQMSIVATGEDKGSSHGAGLSVGGGLMLERFKLGLAYGKYHVSSSSIMVNLSIAL